MVRYQVLVLVVLSIGYSEIYAEQEETSQAVANNEQAHLPQRSGQHMQIDPAVGEPILVQPDSACPENSMETTTQNGTVLERCFLAAKGMGAGVVMAACGGGVGSCSYSTLISLKKGLTNPNSSLFGSAMNSFVYLSIAGLFLYSGWQAGSYSMHNLRSLFRAKL